MLKIFKIFEGKEDKKPFFDYDYAVYFNLNSNIGAEELEDSIRDVKDKYIELDDGIWMASYDIKEVPNSFICSCTIRARDFSIAFKEPAFCPTQAFSIKDPEKLETSLLKMELDELRNAGIHVDNETKTYAPEYVLKLTAARKDVPLSEIRNRAVQLASDLYYKLDREKNTLSNILLHFNDGEMSEIKPV